MNSPPLSQLTTSSRRPDTDKLPMHLSRVFSLSLYFNWHYLDRLTLRSSVSRRLFHLSQTILSQLVFLCRISSPFCLLCSRLLCQIIHCTAIQFLNSSPTLWLQSLSWPLTHFKHFLLIMTLLSCACILRNITQLYSDGNLITSTTLHSITEMK